MGVHGLWHLLEPTGKPVALESLQGKVLAVDVSIWLHQSMKGMKDNQGNAIHNAHLHVLFNRICKLLFYKIKPVFVFDGGVPLLKQQTLAARRQRRMEASVQKETAAKKLLTNVLKQHAINATLGSSSSVNVLKWPPMSGERDLFELNPMPEVDMPENLYQDDWFEERLEMRNLLYEEFQNLEDVDIESDDFQSLPVEVRYEILSDLKQARKMNSWAKLEQLPCEAKDFSHYQMEKLMKQNKLSQKIDNVRKELNNEGAGDISSTLFDDNVAAEMISSKIASDDSTHFVLIKGLSHVPKAVTENLGEHNKSEIEILENAASESKANFYRDEIAAVVEDIKSIKDEEEPNIPQTSKHGVENSHIIDQKNDTPVNLENDSIVSHVCDSEKREGGFIRNDNDDDNKTKTAILGNDYKRKSEIDEVLTSKTIRLESTENDEIQPGDKGTSLALLKPSTSPASSKFPRYSDTTIETNVITEIPNIEKTQRGKNAVISLESESDTDDSDFVEVSENPINVSNEFDSTAEDLQFESNNVDISSEKISDEENTSNFEERFRLSNQVTKNDLLDMKDELETETWSLIAEKGKKDRMMTSITDQMQKEAQDLLKMFGIPYIVAPMEAEAQCAYLDLTEQTDGTITDDSDVFLFGGKRIYRNIFNKNKQVQYFVTRDIEKTLLIDRTKLINLAYLCGCDYTVGVQGIGPVTGMEILVEFHGNKIEGLKKLKTWWEQSHSVTNERDTDTKLKQKLKKLEFGEGFPNEAVYEAFINPEVDESTEKFSWNTPDIDLLREFSAEKLHWKQEKVDEILLPAVKQLSESNSQMQITDFFNKQAYVKLPVKSKRVKRIIDRIRDNEESNVSFKGKSSKKLPAKNSKRKPEMYQMNNGGFEKRLIINNEDLNLSESSSDSD